MQENYQNIRSNLQHDKRNAFIISGYNSDAAHVMKLVDACPWGNYENYFYHWHKTEGYLKDGDLSSLSDFTGLLKEVADHS